MNTPYVLSLSDASATLETVGGKGLSLARLIQAGLPVPGGFQVTTDAYRAFVAVNELQSHILAALQEVDPLLPATFDAASAKIGQSFTAAVVPPDIGAAIAAAYAALLCPAGEVGAPVAVRSSATAEDLPEASFAGQQETFLNVCGEDDMLAAVKKCWASLWTARAIAYRVKNAIDQNTVSLAVVVQEMVNAEAAGILFTANPVNGKRDEIVINAAWGLGEAVVGGLVTPDAVTVEKSTGKIKTMEVAEKTVMTVAGAKGTLEKTLTGARRRAQVLDEAQVAELVGLARRIENEYGSPQDIEWCRAGDRFFILQSRPITRLAEPPLQEAEISLPASWKLPRGAYAAVRNNIVELMADPLSPLFATLGVAAINSSLARVMDEDFGMRGIMPAEIIVVVNQYAYNNGSLSAKGLARVIFGAGRIMKRMFTGAVERWTETGRPRYYQIVSDWQAKDWRAFPAVELLRSARQLTEAAIEAYAALVSGVIPAAWITEALFTGVYQRLLRRRGDPPAPTYLLGYASLPIQADQSLYSLAEWVRQDCALAQHLAQTPSRELAACWENSPVPAEVSPAAWQEWTALFRQHLDRFGHTIYDLDFMHPVPAEDPGPLLDALKLYLRGQGVNPYQRQQQFAERREQAVLAMRQRLKGRRLNWFNRYLASAQKYAPLREDGLAEIGLAYPLIRQVLREVGSRFKQQQVIADPADIFWLTQAEAMQAASQLDAGQPVEPLADTVLQRKAEHRAGLRATPPLALPQMKIFGFDLMSLKGKRGRGGKGEQIKGVAASPGKVTGVARVIHGPDDFSQFQPGDVLVAAITTPAWTPLFALASAVVTDVGGPLSHGSIVAREYGIPAVLGAGVATRRIHSGQTITVDGGAGTVLLKVG